jgi:hypothetical protein
MSTPNQDPGLIAQRSEEGRIVIEETAGRVALDAELTAHPEYMDYKSMANRVAAISRMDRDALSKADRDFVGALADEGSRILTRVAENGEQLEGPESDAYAKAAATLLGNTNAHPEARAALKDFGADKRATLRVLGEVTALTPSISMADGTLRAQVEDLAIAAADLLGQVEDFPFDDHLFQKLDYVQATYVKSAQQG